MADTEKAVVFTAKEQAELQDKELDGAPLGADEVAGRTLASLISPGTEIWGSYLANWFPQYPGYAAVFEVEDVGAEVDGLKAGDVCFCTGPQGIGGHKERQRCPRAAAIRVPDGLAPEVALHARLMGVSMSTLTTTVARPPDKVLVSGLGPVGHLAAQIFKSCGYDVTAVDPIAERRKLAEGKGIATIEAIPGKIEQQPIHGYQLVVECSGHEAGILAGARAVRKRGEIVLVGVPRERKTDLYMFDLVEAIFKKYAVCRSGWEWEISRHPAEIRIGSVFGNLAGAVQWLAEDRIDVSGLYEKRNPADCQEVYQDLLNRRAKTLSVVFDWA